MKERRNRLEHVSLLVAAFAAFAAAAAAGASFYQASVSERTAEQQLRAYVGVDSISISDIKPGELIVSFTILNAGQTPVYNLRTEMAIDVREYPLTRATPMQATFRPDIPYFIQNAYPGDIRSRRFSPDEISAILEGGSKRLYVAAQMVYEDTFRHPRRTNFCFMYAKTLQSGLQFVSCEDFSGARLNFAD